MEIISTLLVAFFVIWFLVTPFFQTDSLLLAEGSHNSLALKDQIERCLQVLKDLDLDYSTAKIQDEDYQRTKTTLENELAALLETFDAQKAQDRKQFL